ncbi:MAG: hypothetical protein Q6M04_05140 [Thermostichus sp. BF3_bins_97]
MSLEINISPDLEHQLQEAAARAGLAPQEFVIELLERNLVQELSLPVQRLSKTEGELFQIINRSLSEREWQEYQALQQKRDSELLTPADQQRLTQLSDQLENLNVDRMQALTSLALLRQTTVTALIEQLGLKSNAHA